MFKLVVLSVVLAVAAANPNGVWGAGLATSWASPVAVAAPLAPIFTTHFAPVGPVAPIGAHNYRGPFSLAPGQPANILAADGRPLDTLSVNLDRAVHYNAQAIENNGRRLQKRSTATNIVVTPLTLGRSWVGPAPIAVSAGVPIAPLGLGVGARGNIW